MLAPSLPCKFPTPSPSTYEVGESFSFVFVCTYFHFAHRDSTLQVISQSRLHLCPHSADRLLKRSCLEDGFFLSPSFSREFLEVPTHASQENRMLRSRRFVGRCSDARRVVVVVKGFWRSICEGALQEHKHCRMFGDVCPILRIAVYLSRLLKHNRTNTTRPP